jgi:integrase
MTPLRQRLTDDLRLRNYSPRTIETYVYAVARFAKHFGRSPAELGPEEIRAYQLHLVDRERASWSRFNGAVCALRFLYGVTLGRPGVVSQIPFGKRPRALPSVLSREEVLRVFAAFAEGRDRTLVRTAYACGLRVGEAVRLRVGDIDGGRGLLAVRRGKGGKDRLVPLSPLLLGELRASWRRQRPADWLFPGRRRGRPLHAGAWQRLFAARVRPLGLGKPVTMHTLRHSYATHLLEAGADVVSLQRLLGHRHLSTTAGYLHLSAGHLRRLAGPLDELLALPVAAAAPPAGPVPPWVEGPGGGTAAPR